MWKLQVIMKNKQLSVCGTLCTNKCLRIKLYKMKGLPNGVRLLNLYLLCFPNLVMKTHVVCMTIILKLAMTGILVGLEDEL